SNTEQRDRVARWINHDPYSGFRRRKRSPMHDLALVRLAEPARFTPYVQPMALRTQCPQTGELCVVTGWGSTGTGECVCVCVWGGWCVCVCVGGGVWVFLSRVGA